MRFTLEIQCDNEAFGEDDDARGQELARILHKAAEQVSEYGCSEGMSRLAKDLNGNTVGGWRVTRG